MSRKKSKKMISSTKGSGRSSEKKSLTELDLKKLSQKFREKRDSEESTTKKSKSNRDKKLKSTKSFKKEDFNKKDSLNIQDFFAFLNSHYGDKRIIIMDDEYTDLVILKDGMSLEEFIAEAEEEMNKGSIEKFMLGDKLVLREKHMKSLKDLDCLKVIYANKRSFSTNSLRFPENLVV